MSNTTTDDKLADLKSRYRQIEAPQQLATRIRASVANRPVRNGSWLPVTASAALTAVLIGLVPLLWQSSSAPETRPATPSLATLAALSVERPAVQRPRLSQIRTLPSPGMPAKPKLKPPAEQDNSTTRNFEENNHAQI
ncbi:MAG: hypothetical protein AAGE85_02310 [Pseudomonadota bacterium]